MGHRPHRKDPSSKIEGELKQSDKNSGPDSGNQFCRKPVWTLGPRCGVLGNFGIKRRENIRVLHGKSYNSGLMAYFCKSIDTLVPSQYLIRMCKNNYIILDKNPY